MSNNSKPTKKENGKEDGNRDREEGPAGASKKLQAVSLHGDAGSPKTKSNYYFVDFKKGADNGKYGWWHNKGDKTVHLGMFDLELHGRIKRHNPESGKWDQILMECQLFYPSLVGSYVASSPLFFVDVKDLLSVDGFRITTFKHAYEDHKFKNNSELTSFFAHIMKETPPKEVYEFDYYGFTRIENQHFYLTENALITIPGDHETESQYIIAPDESGMFPLLPIGSMFHIKPGRVEPAPALRLPRPDTGIYPTDDLLFDDQEMKWFIHEVRENLGELVAGQKPHLKPEGYMIFAFMMSFLFFEEIYDEFKHVTYLYIWGEPSTGKGKLSQIMLNFFGQSFNDVDSSPTLKSAENKLANHSQIPVVMDEFHPEKSKISSQIFNMWYELRQRGVSASHDRSKNAWSPVRSQIMFISNFKPTEDHFRSRCLMIEYAREKRGQENIVFWFNKQERDMQRLFMSLLFRYNTYNRELFKAELHTTKQLLSQALTKELERRTQSEGVAFQVKDRQIENMTALVVVDKFICNPETVMMIETYEAEAGGNNLDGEFLEEYHKTLMDARTESPFFHFAVQFLANSAEREVQQTPLQQFLATLEVISEKSQLNSDYHSQRDGDILFYWSGVWDEYTKYQQGREIVPEKTLRDEIEAYDVNGKAKTHKWKNSMGDDVYRHGYRIPKWRCTASWYRAFGHRILANELVKYDSSAGEDPESQTNSYKQASF